MHIEGERTDPSGGRALRWWRRCSDKQRELWRP